MSVRGVVAPEPGEVPMESTSLNIAVLRGVCSSPAEVRVLPSEQVLVQLQITTRVDDRAVSVPVAVLEPAAWVENLDTGDEVVVVGHVRRRFFRAGGATASRVEIEAETVARARDRRRWDSVRRRIEAQLAEVST
jgi:single-strand DNA-binding protein